MRFIAETDAAIPPLHDSDFKCDEETIAYIRNLFAGMVYTLWIDPKYRNQGLGREIKTRAETWAQKHQLDHIFTWINTRNEPSISLNQKLGYEIVNYKLKKKL